MTVELQRGSLKPDPGQSLQTHLQGDKTEAQFTFRRECDSDSSPASTGECQHALIPLQWLEHLDKEE